MDNSEKLLRTRNYILCQINQSDSDVYHLKSALQITEKIKSKYKKTSYCRIAIIDHDKNQICDNMKIDIEDIFLMLEVTKKKEEKRNVTLKTNLDDVIEKGDCDDKKK
jgi:hypothetical protein